MDTALLIKEAKHGSSAAQKCLFDTWAGKMHILCRRYVKNEMDAEEILLDSFYKFFKTLASFHYRNDAELNAWIKRIMINECLAFLRKKNVFNMIGETAAVEISQKEEAVSNLSAAEIFHLGVQLPLGYRTVFNLHVIEGFDHREIAALLNISEGTSKSQLSRAKALLQKMLLTKRYGYVRRKTQ